LKRVIINFHRFGTLPAHVDAGEANVWCANSSRSAIVGGHPAKPMRARFPGDVVTRVLALRWRDWSDERVRRAAPMLQNPDIAAFLDAAEEGRI
jgi:hypothetical protein